MNTSKSSLVSILVPLYNHEQYINECLDSLVHQTHKNIEIIVINDGSTDDSDMIIKRWIENNPSININYMSQENHGVTKTLNKMIKIAKGDYITLCASDDVLLENSIAIRLNYLQEHKNLKAVIGDANVIGTHSELINESAMKSLFYANYKRLVNNIKSELVLNWSVVGPTFLAEKSVYEKVGLYDETLLVEDREFYLRLLANDLLGFLPQTVAKYRIHMSNISRKSKKAKWNIYNQIAISNLKHADKFNGINNIFLVSNNIDFYLTNTKYLTAKYIVLNLFRLFRRILARFLLIIFR